MKTNYYRLWLVYGCFSANLLVTSCMKPGPTPPVAFISIDTFYKTDKGVDLLNSATPNSFKKQDLKIISKVDEKGTIKEVIFNQDGVGIFVDGITGFSYIEVTIPTNFGTNPLATYITLSPTITDTVTYTYGPTKYKYVPDKIYYNKKLVWEEVNIPSEGKFPPITIIK